MSHSPQFKILLSITIVLTVFCVTTVLFAADHQTQPAPAATASPQVAPTPVPPPNAGTTDPTASNQNDHKRRNQVPVQQSIYSDLANLVKTQNQRTHQVAPTPVPQTVQQPAAVFPSATPLAPVKTEAPARVLSYFPFINSFTPSANAYGNNGGFSPHATALLTDTSYGLVIIGIALVLIKPKNIAIAPSSFKKPVSSI